MALYGAPQSNPKSEPQAPGQVNPSMLSQLWDAMRAGTAGFRQGLIGKDLTFEQWQQERARKRQGLPPGQYPQNWFQRLTRR